MGQRLVILGLLVAFIVAIFPITTYLVLLRYVIASEAWRSPGKGAFPSLRLPRRPPKRSPRIYESAVFVKVVNG